MNYSLSLFYTICLITTHGLDKTSSNWTYSQSVAFCCMHSIITLWCGSIL